MLHNIKNTVNINQGILFFMNLFFMQTGESSMNQFFVPLINDFINDLPLSVTAFTFLRHGMLQNNEMNYPEITCLVPLSDGSSSGDIASKLTVALTIHIDSFIGLITKELNDELNNVQVTARFSHLLSPEDVDNEIALKASDIIDTLISLS
jgi:hypothetical protein